MAASILLCYVFLLLGSSTPRFCYFTLLATVHPTPYNIHPTPYTIHPTPYTIHPTPYTIHHTPYTIHPTPYTLYILAQKIKIGPGPWAPWRPMGPWAPWAQARAKKTTTNNSPTACRAFFLARARAQGAHGPMGPHGAHGPGWAHGALPVPMDPQKTEIPKNQPGAITTIIYL